MGVRMPAYMQIPPLRYGMTIKDNPLLQDDRRKADHAYSLALAGG
jgi:hypothetical protein